MRPALGLVAILLFGCGRTLPLHYQVDASVTLLDSGVEDAGVTPCIPGTVTLTRAQPTVLFVIDRSGSMNFAFGSSTRWVELRKGLAQALPPVDQTTAIGAYLFPQSGNFNQSCGVSTSLDLAPAIGNATPLNNLLARSTPVGGTPTADALDVAAQQVRTIRAATSARALVLATDGAPGCNNALNPFTCVCTRDNGCGTYGSANCLDDTRTISRMQTITDSGLPTWVIGIQDGTDKLLDDVLNRMAVAGGRPRANATKYYPASNPEQLDAALVSIRDQIGACTFLTASVPDAQGAIRVFLDGRFIAEDSANGWQWANRPNGELEFVGAACARVNSGAVVTANVGCSEPRP